MRGFMMSLCKIDISTNDGDKSHVPLFKIYFV